MEIIFLGYKAVALAYTLVGYVLAIMAVYGGIRLLSTREDAFFLLNRDKNTWVALCFGAALLLFLGAYLGMSMLLVIGAVILGIYWQDIRPSLKEILG